MRETQLRLFTPAKPLTERFGRDFFRALPKEPGVYLMFDAQGRCIYVGQSKNLRQRVTSYRHVHPDRNSRKVVRLVHAVARIEWETCPDPKAAKLRENFLLRSHRPRFNSMNTYPKIHCFVGLRLRGRDIEFVYTRQEQESDFEYFGAFKSGCLAGFVALLRLLWGALHDAPILEEYPRCLLGARPPVRFSLNFGPAEPAETCELLTQFLSGRSDALRTWLAEQFESMAGLSKFQQALIAADLEQVERFYRFGPQRNALLQAKHQLTAPLIGQEQLDDLLVDWKQE